MSNLEKYEGFFETELSCLSAEQLDKYVQEKLTKKEKYQVEKHLLNCEFCTEAVQGISTFGKAINLSEISQQINSEIAAKYFSKQNKAIPLFSYFKVAASVIILITVGLFIFNKNFPESKNLSFVEEKQLREHFSVDEEENSETSLSQNLSPILEKEKQKEEQKKDKVSELRKEKDIKIEQTKNARNLSASPTVPKEKDENTSISLEVESVENKNNEKEILADFTVEEMEEEVSDDEGLGFAADESQDPLIEESKEESIVLSAQGSDFGNQKAVKQATGKKDEASNSLLKKLKKEVKKKPNDLDLSYRYALTYFDNKQWDKSLDEFEKVLSDTLQTHYYDAIWYSALINIEKGNSKLAKKKLNKLLTNGVYGDKAKGKLKEIE